MKISRCLFFIPFGFLFMGCSVYRDASIDQAGISKGLSISDIEHYIYETDRGPNIFLDRDEDDRFISTSVGHSCQVWVEEYLDEEGAVVPGHYVEIEI